VLIKLNKNENLLRQKIHQKKVKQSEVSSQENLQAYKKDIAFKLIIFNIPRKKRKNNFLKKR
jgi:hypothetical protein